jgi:hypothetical protein
MSKKRGSDPALSPTEVWPARKKDAFCSAHSQLGDGRVLVAGGEDGTKVPLDSLQHPTGINTVWIFDPASPTTLQELPTASMAYVRWYGTPNVLPDGRVSVTSGTREPDPDPSRRFRVAEKPEIYDPYTGSSGSWTTHGYDSSRAHPERNSCTSAPGVRTT